MIKLKVTRRVGRTQSLHYECPQCKNTCYRGLISVLEIRPFRCWSCGTTHPALLNLVNHEWARVNYHRTGNVPAHVTSGLY